jgi:serine/threonine protein kinase
VLEQLSSALDSRYRLERELGQGGMATVYLAEDLKHGRKVAIKVLRPELAAVIGAERFLLRATFVIFVSSLLRLWLSLTQVNGRSIAGLWGEKKRGPSSVM